MNTIAVDAMGGDSAPVEVVKGAIKAKEDGVNVVLCGDENLIKPYLGSTEIPVYHYPQVISMDEDPLKAIRAKKEASIVGCMQLLKEKKVEAVFSAGSTGATLISAITILGKQKGVIRPAIASILPNSDSSVILLDSGASLDVKPKILYQFAVMGSKLAEVLLQLDNPRVGLLNNGEEESKGRDLEKSAYKLLSSSNLNFIGNVEGHDLFSNRVDVVVCDGFIGNIVLKTCESLAHGMFSWLKRELTSTTVRKLGAMMAKGAFKTIKGRMDPDAYGGAPLLGLNGNVFIAHGSAGSLAFKNAIRMTAQAFEHHINDQMTDAIAVANEQLKVSNSVTLKSSQ